MASSASGMFASMANTPMMSYLEGPAPEFVALDDKYICVHCKKLLKQPQQTSCGHRICAPCVGAVLQDKTSVLCPGGDEFCEQITRDSVYPDMATLREMSRLKVFCPYKSYGCKVETMWSKLKEHKESCEYAVEECVYREFGCTEMVPIKAKDSHATSCPYKPKRCSHCGQDIAACKMELHVSQECDQAPIPCPYKCGEQSITRAELQNHHLVCRAKPQECRYKDAGCTFKGSETEVRAHQEDVNFHLQLFYIQQLKHQKDAATRENKIMGMQDSLESSKKQLNAVLKQKDELEKKIKFWEHKVNKLELTVANTTQEMIRLEEKVTGQQTSMTAYEKKMQDVNTKQNAHERKITILEQKGGGAGLNSDLGTKLLQLERTLGITDMRLADIDQRFQHSESTSYDGTLIWKITDYMRRKEDAVSGRNVSLYSQPFYSSRFGYKMCMRVYLNGDGIGRDTHMSLFFVLMKGEFDALLKWPFSQKVTLTLMDQERGVKPLSDMFRPDPTSSSFARPRMDMNIASGCPLFVAHTQLESSSFLRDNTLFIKCFIGEEDKTGIF